MHGRIVHPALGPDTGDTAAGMRPLQGLPHWLF